MKGRDERVLLSNAAHSKGFDRRLGGGGGRLSRFFKRVKRGVDADPSSSSFKSSSGLLN